MLILSTFYTLFVFTFSILYTVRKLIHFVKDNSTRDYLFGSVCLRNLNLSRTLYLLKSCEIVPYKSHLFCNFMTLLRLGFPRH